MKICHLMLSCFYKEGAGYQENLLPKYHAKLGYDVRIASNSNDWNETPINEETSYVNADGIHVTIFKTNKPRCPQIHYLQVLSSLYRNRVVGIYEYLQREKPNVIFVHGGTHPGNLEIVKYAKRNKVRLYVDQHADYYNSPVKTWKQRFVQTIFLKPIVKQLYNLCDTYWGVTPWRVQYLRDIYNLPVGKTKLLVMGGDDERIDYEHKNEIRSKLRVQYGIAEDEFLIVTGGKIDPAKNIHLLIDAIRNFKEVKLLIFGKPVDSFIKDYENVCENNSFVINIGWLPADQVYDYFLAADLVVFPGTHSVLWEQTVACGVPCVVKRWEGMQHVNVNGNCAFIDYEEKEKSDAIVKTLSPILLDKDYWNKMKDAAEKCRHEFLYSYIAKKSIGGNEQ